MSYSAVGYELNTNESTIRYIQKNEEEIHQSVHETTPESAKATSIIHNETMEKIEVAKFMDSWGDDPF